MADVITCPRCQRRLHLPEEHRGREVRCPSCHTKFLSSVEADPGIPWVIPVDVPATAQTPTRVGNRQARSTVGPLVIALLATVVVVVVAGGVFVLVSAQRQGALSARRAADEDAALRQDMIDAFRDQRPLAEDEIAAEVRPLFTDLGEALRAADGTRSVGHFDLDRLFDELLAMELVPANVRNERRTFVRAARDGLAISLRQQAPLMAWQTFEIRNVKKLQNNEAVVIVRHKTPDGIALKLRWWLSKRTGTWKVYDFEDLDVGCRSSTTMGSVMHLGVGRIEAIARATKSVREALLILHGQRDPDAAERCLQAEANVPLPPRLEALRKFTRGLIQFERGQHREALATFDEAAALNPDMPFLDFMKGAAHNQLGDHERALTHLHAYRDLLGEDAVISYQLGLALAGLRRSKEALASFRRALDDDPKFSEAFHALVESLQPGDARDDLRARFAKLDTPRAHFDALAESCQTARDGESLAELCAAMRDREPAYPPIAFYESLVAPGTSEATRQLRTSKRRSPRRRTWRAAARTRVRSPRRWLPSGKR
jgi:tetratricopeptide (TPR) repeat protein/DNA-directed RNA polymerase subunit RPC12/RpoP